MTKGNLDRRVPALGLTLALAAGALASCGSSSPGTHAAPSVASAPSTSTGTQPSPTDATPTTGKDSPGSGATSGGGGAASGNGGTAAGSGGSSSSGTKTQGKGGTGSTHSTPLARAQSFVSCMRAHGIQLPPATGSGSGAALDFKGVDTKSARYKAAAAACSNKLLEGLPAGATKGAHFKGTRLKDIHVRGVHAGSVHVGHVEVPAIHLPPLHLKFKVPKIHVKTPSLPGITTSSGEPGT